MGRRSSAPRKRTEVQQRIVNSKNRRMQKILFRSSGLDPKSQAWIERVLMCGFFLLLLRVTVFLCVIMCVCH